MEYDRRPARGQRPIENRKDMETTPASERREVKDMIQTLIIVVLIGLPLLTLLEWAEDRWMGR